MPDPVIVLIEDEPQIRRFLRATLTGQGYRLFEAGTAADGLVEVASRQPDVVIIDLGLPDLDGLEVIRRLREWSKVPVIVLSARGQERDKVGALDAGADDYVSKPFSAGELLARVRVALRHAAGAAHEESAAFTVGELQVDLLRRHVTVAGTEVRLTPIEYKLLATLVRLRGPRGDASAAVARRVGADSRRPVPLRARLHGPPAPQDRGPARAAALSAHRAGSGLPAGGGVTPAGRDAPRIRSPVTVIQERVRWSSAVSVASVSP